MAKIRYDYEMKIVNQAFLKIICFGHNQRESHTIVFPKKCIFHDFGPRISGMRRIYFSRSRKNCRGGRKKSGGAEKNHTVVYLAYFVDISPTLEKTHLFDDE